MMELLKKLEIPLCQPQRIPIKTLIAQLQLGSADKKILETHIASMKLVSILNEQTIRTRPYKDDEYTYQSIYVFFIKLKKDDSITTLSNLIHSAFPEPTILLLTCSESEWISVATKRINKLNRTRTVVDDITVQKVNTELNEYLSLKNISSFNLKDYYLRVVQLVYKIGIYNVVHVFPNQDLDYKSIIKEYQHITANIDSLKKQYKKALTKSSKMSIDDRIYDEEYKLGQIIKQIKGERLL